MNTRVCTIADVTADGIRPLVRFVLSGGRFRVTAARGKSDVARSIMRTPVFLPGGRRQVTAAENPAGWFSGLPAAYQGTRMRAVMSKGVSAAFDPDEPRDEAGKWTVARGLKPVKERAYTGEQKTPVVRLSKMQTRDIGEQLAVQYAKRYLPNGDDARLLNTVRNNVPVDIQADHTLIEAKCGLASVTPSARQWNAKIGQPGKAYYELDREGRAKWNDAERRAILHRKKAMLRRASEETGTRIKGMTITSIIDPDRRLADLYVFRGFHLRIGWNSEDARKNYVGSFRY